MQEWLVWRWGNKGDNWTAFGFVKMHFGDQPVATGLEVAKEIASEEGKAINKGMASKMMKGGYVDDHIVGGTEEECTKMKGKCSFINGEYFCDGTISKTLDQVGMRPKVIVSNKDKDPVTIHKLGDTFLGYNWRIQEDVIVMNYNVNTSKTKHGVIAKPSVQMETID